jgi:dihydrofolate reductase
MAKLIYAAITSVDGYIEDRHGEFGWAEPDEEVHSFVNEVSRPIGTYLYGRRLYETMAYWERPPDVENQPQYVQDYAKIWQGAEKIVYSTTLESASTARTRLEHEFDPEAVRELKARAAADLIVGGADLAAQAIAAELVDEIQLFLVPAVVGGGKPALPNVRVDLELLDERRFGNGTAYLRYQTRW